MQTAKPKTTYFVIGKGGVGKTTVAAGLALALAQRDGEAILVEFSDGDASARLFAPDEKNVQRVVLRLNDAVTTAAAKVFGSALLARIALGNFAIKPLVRATPALRELAVMEGIRSIAAGNPNCHVVVDLPATGHGLAWLKVPRQGVDLLQRGPLHGLCLGICRELLVPERSALWVVSLAERLVLRETAELCRELAEQVGLPVAKLVINRAQPTVPEAALAEARERAKGDDSYALACATLASVLASRKRASDELQRTVSEELQTWANVIATLPLQTNDPTARQVAAQLEEGAVL